MPSNPRYPHLSTRPVITVGAIHTPTHYAQRGWRNVEQRDYRDGLRVIILERTSDVGDGSSLIVAWNAAKGIGPDAFRTCERKWKSPADIGATVRRARRDLFPA